MSKMAMDALNRGWNLGLATGRVQAVQDSDLDLLAAEKCAQAVQTVTLARLVSKAASDLAVRLARHGAWQHPTPREQH